MTEEQKPRSTKPVSKWLRNKAEKIKLPGFEGLSLYHLWEIYSIGILKGTFATRASATSFSFFMALFPFLLFILNLIPYVPIDDFQLEFLVFVDSLLPPTTTGFFNDIFADIASTPRGKLLSFVFLLSIFLMSNGINAIFSGFEYSYHSVNNRTIIRQYLMAIVVSIILALLFLVAVIVTFYLTYVIEDLKSLGVVTDTVVWAQVGRYATFVLLVFFTVAILYYFGTKEGKKSRFFSIGAFFTTFLILITTFLFGIYIENFSSYNELYGSIGALLILMFYIWLNSNIILLGFELNASIYKLKQNF